MNKRFESEQNESTTKNTMGEIYKLDSPRTRPVVLSNRNRSMFHNKYFIL